MALLLIIICLSIGAIIGFTIGKASKTFTTQDKIAINSYWIDKAKEDEIIQIIDVDFSEARVEGRYFRYSGKNQEIPGSVFNLSISSLVMKHRKIEISDYSNYGIDSSSTYWRI